MCEDECSGILWFLLMSLKKISQRKFLLCMQMYVLNKFLPMRDRPWHMPMRILMRNPEISALGKRKELNSQNITNKTTKTSLNHINCHLFYLSLLQKTLFNHLKIVQIELFVYCLKTNWKYQVFANFNIVNKQQT